MESLPLEILKFGALGPVCAVLMWLLVRADRREQAADERDAARNTQLFEMLKTSYQAAATTSQAMDGVKQALEALKSAFAGGR